VVVLGLLRLAARDRPHFLRGRDEHLARERARTRSSVT
jgi:hypothetical protein